jgi:hypothetical protein
VEGHRMHKSEQSLGCVTQVCTIVCG